VSCDACQSTLQRLHLVVSDRARSVSAQRGCNFEERRVNGLALLKMHRVRIHMAALVQVRVQPSHRARVAPQGARSSLRATRLRAWPQQERLSVFEL
jgi:hypothetical protein